MREKLLKAIEVLGKIDDVLLDYFVIWSRRVNALCQYKTIRPTVTTAQKREIKKYWSKYTKKNWSLFQILTSNINGEFSPKYIPEDIYVTKIDKYLNRREFVAMDNKCYYPLYFDCHLPKMIFMRINGLYYDAEYRIISKEVAIALAEQSKAVIFKPATGSCGGNGIKIWRVGGRETISDILSIDFDTVSDYVVQKVLRQHKDIARIHESSLNTIRIMTLIIDGKAQFLSGTLRIGSDGGIVDNFCGGGYAVGIKSDGRLKKYGYKEAGQRFTKHPQAGEFSQYFVPSYEKAKSLAVRQAEKFPYFRLIAWDIAIDENGEPVLIEANFHRGTLTLVEYTNGPLFGKYTDKVLAEVFKDKK